MTEELNSPTKKSQTIAQKMSMQFRTSQFQEKQAFLCAFCGGGSCKQQDYRTNTKLPNAINGVHSNWITSDIVAMQRLSEKIIAQHNVYVQLKQKNIMTVLNLQEPGEHASCGDGLAGHCGFSYVPQKLFQYGIQYFNYSWEDMTATTVEYMMKIMNTFHQTFQMGGKIAVHCHAGRGRTLLAICSWLIYSGLHTAKSSIQLAVQKRDGVLTKNSQRQFLHDFEKCKNQQNLDLKDQRSNCFKPIKMSFQLLTSTQQQILLNYQKSKYGGTPFVHANIINELTERCKDAATAQLILLAFSDMHHKQFEPWGQTQQNGVKKLKDQLNQLKFDAHDVKDIRILTETLFDFYDQMHYVQFTQTYCCVIQSEFDTKLQAHEILISPELVNTAGIHILCCILSFSEFLYKLYERIKDRSEEVQKQLREQPSIRVVKLLMTKRKYFAKSYKGRHLIRPAQLTQSEMIFKKFFDLLIRHHSEKEQDLRLQVKIKRVAADMHFHMTQLKKQEDKHIFDKHEMKKIYDLSRHKV